MGVRSDRLRLFFPIHATDKIRSQAIHHGVQLVHDHGIWLPINHAACAAAKSLQIPYVISPRGMLNAWPMQHKQMKKRIAMWLYQRRNLENANMFFATSHLEADDIRAVGLQKPIAIVPNGVFLPANGRRERPRSNAGERIALFLSRIHPKKGLPDFVNAWAACNPRGWKLVIAGPDEENHLAQVKQLVSERGLNKVVSFSGSVEGTEKEDLFENADLFVLPSHSENFGIVVAEALSYGVPVITTRVTPWEELISHTCGWWVGDNEIELGNALREATASPAERLWEMGQRGRQLVAEKYSWSGAAGKVSECYDWILGTGPKPACIVDSLII